MGDTSYVHSKKHCYGSLYVELNKVNGGILILSILVCTDAELQVVSCRLRKLLAEPREVWRMAACSLKSTTILSIPQWVIRVENKSRWLMVKSCLTVVVRPNKSRRRCSIIYTSAWTGLKVIMFVSICCGCIRPDVLPWTAMSYANSINIRIVNSATESWENKVGIEGSWCPKLVPPYSPTHLSVLNSISRECD